MRNIIAISLLLFVGLPTSSYAQNPEVDSLKNELIGAQLDTNQLATLMSLSSKLYRVNPDTGIVYSQRAIDLATQLNRKEDLGYALKNIGLSHYFKSNFQDVLIYWQQSLDAFKSINHIVGISNLLNNLGAVYYSKGDNAKALEYYIESLKFAQEADDKKRVATAYVNIGAVHAEDEDTYDLARENYLKSMAISEEIGAKDAIGTVALNIGELYFKENKPDEALPYLEKGLANFKEIDGNIATAYYQIGNAYKGKNDFNKALEYYNQALSTATEKDTKLDQAQAFEGIAAAQYGLGNFQAAINAYKASEKVATEIDGKNELTKAYSGLAQSYAAIKNYKNAFNNQVKYFELVEAVRSEKNEEKLSNLRFQFDLDSKEKAIALLNSENELNEAKIERNSIFQNFLLAVGALLVLLLGGVFYQYKFAKKSNLLLEKERNRAEDILLNILPKDTADELKANGFVNSRDYKQTTVMFTDFKGFTQVSENLPGNELVNSIDYYFKKFDEIITKFNLEKIKTIGDSYMCAGGLPTANKSNPIDAVKASMEIMKFVKETHANPPEGIYPFEVRIGMNTGPLVAGVVGTKKFQYDIWGSTVNIASRMESSAEEGKINISDNTYQLIKEYFECKYRGEIEVKNAGKQKMYYVERGLPGLAGLG